MNTVIAKTFRQIALIAASFVAVPLMAAPATADVDEPDSVVTSAAAATSIAAPKVGNDFRSAFDAWRRLDAGSAAAGIGTTIALPSRKPVDLMSLSSAYGMRVHPVTGQLARHNGIDIPAPKGTPIYASADGTVGRAQRLGGYGNYVEINHGSDIQTRYGHMSSFIVTSGQQVKKGQVIGFVGSTGRSTGNHLHYEVRIAGTPVNPVPFVQHGEQFAQAGRDAAKGGPQ